MIIANRLTPNCFKLILILLISATGFHADDIEWRSFNLRSSEPQEFSFETITAIVKPRLRSSDKPFPGDSLQVVIKEPDERHDSYWFNSSYGKGALAIAHGLVLLRRGTGRGTSVRTESVVVLSCNGIIRQLCEVPISYWVPSSDPGNMLPNKLRYALSIQRHNGQIELQFRLGKQHPSLPSEKTILLASKEEDNND